MSASLLSMIAILQEARTDTVVMVPARDAFDYVQGGGILLILVVLFLLLAVLVRVLQTVEGLRRSLNPLLERAGEGLAPVLERARSISANVDFVSHAVRQDVKELTEAIDRIRKRLDQASDRMDQRIEDFNALMEVVQSEAEDIFIDTAATVRGVRAGSRSLAESDAGRGRGDTEGRDGRGGEAAGPGRDRTGVGDRAPPLESSAEDEPRSSVADDGGPNRRGPARSATPDGETANAAE